MCHAARFLQLLVTTRARWCWRAQLPVEEASHAMPVCCGVQAGLIACCPSCPQAAAYPCTSALTTPLRVHNVHCRRCSAHHCAPLCQPGQRGSPRHPGQARHQQLLRAVVAAVRAVSSAIRACCERVISRCQHYLYRRPHGQRRNNGVTQPAGRARARRSMLHDSSSRL